MDLSGQVALVTGASRGIGVSIAAALAAAGASVVGTATSEQGAEGISERFRESGHTGRGVVLDVTRDEAVAAAVADISANEGPVTLLVNNAGVTRDSLLLRMKQEDWDAVVDTDLTAVFRTTKACLRGMMKARNGRIVNIGSVVGLMGNPGQANYCAAKAGLVGFTRSLAREVGSRGITANAVAPGFIETDMTRALSDAQRQSLEGQIPLERLGTPEDVAGVVVFLCSAAAAYITGEVINVNGGMYMA
ncbi:MAG: 3-oxoacyl-ACP reductase FabG [Gammaproteobacteria bacterium]